MPLITVLLVIGMFIAYLSNVPFHWWLELAVIFLSVFLFSRSAKAKTLFLYVSVVACGAFAFQFSEWRKSDVDTHKYNLMSEERQELIHRLSKTSLGNEEFAVVVAMTLGCKDYISKELKNVYSRTGASHVLALSGMHLSIIYFVLMYIICQSFFVVFYAFSCLLQKMPVNRLSNWLIDNFPEFYVLRNTAAVVTCCVVWLYVLLVGSMPSVVRAALMLSIYTISTLLFRDKRGINVLAITAFVMLLLNPGSLFDVGFQMSFLAVLGIILFFPYLSFRRNTSKVMKPIKWLWNAVALSISAQILVMPLIAYYFSRVTFVSALLSPFVSLTAASIIILSLTLIVLSLVSIPLLSGVLSVPVAIVLDCFAKCQNTLLHYFSQIQYSYVDGVTISTSQLVLIYVIITCFVVMLRILLKSIRC